MQQWISSEATNTQLWALGGVMNAALWMMIVFPLAYRVLFVPFGSKPFWGRMAETPGHGAVLIVLHLLGGPFLIVPGLAGVWFLSIAWVFKASLGVLARKS